MQLPPSPQHLRRVLEGTYANNRKHRKSLRAYNCSLQLASSGVEPDKRVDGLRGPGSFSIHGATYHQIGPLRPPPPSTDGSQSAQGGRPPQFAQLYIHGGQRELTLLLN